ncbi:MAG: hypothetical protein ORN58_07095, partial [Sediminibacterium sp.]|nr:hypothetical protein [Sediminibacterium sp.]
MSNRIIISNPIYDTVFQYLMDDIESAKIIISTLINRPIINLIPLTNNIVDIEKKESEEKYIHLMRLDYTAEILNPDDTKELVSIELQKARLRTDEIRFRKYIAENLKKTEVIVQDQINPKTNLPYTIEKAYRIIPIFILNFEIEKEIFDLVLQTEHIIKGIFTEKELTSKNNFLENLMYNVIVVQLPYINRVTQNIHNQPPKLALYNLFQLFNQNKPADRDKHTLFIEENDIPKDYNRIIKRLANLKANESQLEQKLILEDTMLREITEMQNNISYNEQLVKE